jgi:flagellar biosynthesis chaperone FliJ
MGFQFPLAAVLRVRESIEKREERVLQAIQLKVAQTIQQVDELSVAIGGAHRGRELALRQTITGGHLQSLLWEEESAEQRLKSSMGQLQVLEQQSDKQMKVYQGAHRNREMLTDMMKKQKGIYDREWLREEQKRLDDIFMARRHRIG